MNIYIYKLIDPISNEIRYIGKTGNLKNRFTSHLSNSKKLKSKLANWIKSLAKKNLIPIMEVIEISSLEKWEEREIYWISYYKNDKLCNIHIGGKLTCLDNIPKNTCKKYDLHKGKFRVRGSYLNTVYYIGEFLTKEEAIIAYNIFYNDPNLWIIDNLSKKRGNELKKKKVYVYNKEKVVLINTFSSISECSLYYKIDSSNIAACCRNKLKSYKNMFFSYYLLKEEPK